MTNANIIFGQDIQRVFTEIVKDYIEQGMTYSLPTMRGSQGEISKIDVTDGKDVYRINLKSETCHDLKVGLYCDVIVLTVEKFENGAREDIQDTFNTLWTGKGEELHRVTFYSISDRRRQNVYTASREEAIACSKVRNERYSSECLFGKKEQEIRLNSEDALTKVRDMCRNHRGYSRVKRCHIESLKKTVYINGEIAYKVTFTKDCGKDALVVKRINK